MSKPKLTYAEQALNPALRARGIDSFLRVRCWLRRSMGELLQRTHRAAPRGLDVGVALLLITLLAPLLAIRSLVARARYATVCQRQTYIGRQGVAFQLLAFSGAQPGRDLARLANLLRGDLALVGPRLRDSEHADSYSGSDEALRLSLAPGLVSLYALRQSVGIAHESERCIDREFVYTRSVRGDLTLLLRALVSRIMVGSQQSPCPPQLRFFGVTMMNLSMEQAIRWMLDRTDEASRTQVAFANADCLNTAVTDPHYAAVLKAADGVLPDGIGIKLACRIKGIAMRDNINGTDMFPLLCEAAAARGLSMYLLGAGPGIAEAAADNIQQRYPDLRIAGVHHGYLDESEEAAMVDQINNSSADIVLVAMGAPRQELFLARWQDRLQAPLRLGVGGLFDYYSGRISRAPRWLREIGMEWIWRIIQEPGRMWRRYVIGNPLFLYRVWRESDQRADRLLGLPQALRSSRPLQAVSAAVAAIKRYRWNLLQNSARLFKRSLDVLVAGGLFVLLSPLLLLIAVLIRLDSHGPVFFSQTRVGRWGSTFAMWKFRSMHSDAEQRKALLAADNEMLGGVTFKMADDPRITRVGRVIRRLSIDELPQLWNVLRGDMTLVGPRPSLPIEVREYLLGDRGRLEATPGITCIWQVSGRSDIPFEQQVVMDIEYIQTQSVKKDLALLCKTVPAVVSGRGAY
jgi:exopolysaccharide biosynthesis WecB/TagA/CpsF family protein